MPFLPCSCNPYYRINVYVGRQLANSAWMRFLKSHYDSEQVAFLAVGHSLRLHCFAHGNIFVVRDWHNFADQLGLEGSSFCVWFPLVSWAHFDASKK